MNDLCCLAHITSFNSLQKIFKSGNLHTVFEQRNLKLHLGHGYDNLKNKKVNNSIVKKLTNTQFPGIYMRAIPKNYEYTFLGQIILLFPIDLIKQQNWHLNIIDQNGYINNNTYVKKTINKIKNLKNILQQVAKTYNIANIGTEIIFHDKINCNLISSILYYGTTSDKQYNNLVNLIKQYKLNINIIVEDVIQTEITEWKNLEINKQKQNIINNMNKNKNINDKEKNKNLAIFDKSSNIVLDKILSYKLDKKILLLEKQKNKLYVVEHKNKWKCNKPIKLIKTKYQYLDLNSLPFLSYYTDNNYSIPHFNLYGNTETPIQIYRYILEYTGHQLKDLEKITDRKKFNKIIYKYNSFEKLWYNRELQNLKRLPPFIPL